MVASPASFLDSLPTPRTRLIGRHIERATARAFLVDDTVPLLTLHGPGGIGKTRLALAIAAEVSATFADGIVFVDLARITDSALVATTIATALGVATIADRTVIESIVTHLRRLQRLLILDNCEHLLPVVQGLVSVVLDACPAVQVLATSRAPIRV